MITLKMLFCFLPIAKKEFILSSENYSTSRNKYIHNFKVGKNILSGIDEGQNQTVPAFKKVVQLDLYLDCADFQHPY